MEEHRDLRENLDRRPEWLTAFIHQAAERLEPLGEVGRVGFEAQGHEHGWTVGMYLGTTEIIGGPKDGQIEHASFRIDLSELPALFENITSMEWYSVANEDNERFDHATRSVLSVRGTVKADDECHNLHLEILHAPPRYIHPGFRRSIDDHLSLT